MNFRTIFFDYNGDHILEAIVLQVLHAAVLAALGASLVVAMSGGAMAAGMRFYGREHAQFEYFLAQQGALIGKPYTFHDMSDPRLWRAYNPFSWPQKWDFFAPAIATALIAFVAGWL